MGNSVAIKFTFSKDNDEERVMLSGADAGGYHCCQCSTPKWLTLISRVEFSFLTFSEQDSQT